MGLLIPEDLPLDRIPRSERFAVRAFESNLKDSWLIIPRLGITGKRRPYELDVLLVNERYGALGVEVKGGPLEIRDGEWYRRGEHIEVSPPLQAQKAAFALRDRLRDRSPLLRHVHVGHAVVLTDLTELDGQLPLEVTRDQILLLDDLADPEDQLYGLMVGDGRNQALDGDQMEALMSIVRPDVDFRWDPQAHVRNARIRLHRITADQTRALATLDANRRVAVTGPAGSGKTRLALAWADRAIRRGDRVLLTCFNEPMADWLAEAAPQHERLMVGSVQRTLLGFDGMPPIDEPDDAGEDWWRIVPFRHAEENLDRIAERFDTIIVDEAQDFAPEWFKTLERLLDEDGPGRMMLVADPGQGLFDRGFEMPDPDTGVVRASLLVNCRNTHQVANVLRPLGGAPAAPGAPEGEPVDFMACESTDQVIGALSETVERLVGEELVDPANILVVSGSRSIRDRIRVERPGGFEYEEWEGRGEGHIICETIHRTKGLERDAVILVTTNEVLSDRLLYVGMSRAVSRLVVIGPGRLVDRLQTLGRLRSAGLPEG